MRCPVVFIQEFYSNIHDIDTSVPQFATQFRGKCIVVTLDLVVGVLRVPKVVHPDYPTMIISELCLETNSSPFFYGTPSIWCGKLNTPCSSFAKGPRFLNMVMTFTLTHLSHYNSITELHARFLLSLMEDFSFSLHHIDHSCLSRYCCS